MSRHYRYRRSKDTEAAGSFVLVIAAAVIIAYQKLSTQALELLIAGALLLVVTVIGLVLLLHFKRAEHERQKLRTLSMVGINVMDPLAFEKYVAELLKSQGYGQITLTEKYDYGVDIIAVKDDISWGIQVKRYSDLVKAEAVRQVVTALRQYNCQRSMVVTNNVFSRPAKVLAASNNCVLIDRDGLAEWMVAFQAKGSRKSSVPVSALPQV
jgi:restriction system protein